MIEGVIATDNPEVFLKGFDTEGARKRAAMIDDITARLVVNVEKGEIDVAFDMVVEFLLVALNEWVCDADGKDPKPISEDEIRALGGIVCSEWVATICTAMKRTLAAENQRMDCENQRMADEIRRLKAARWGNFFGRSLALAFGILLLAGGGMMLKQGIMGDGGWSTVLAVLGGCGIAWSVSILNQALKMFFDKKDETA